MTIGLLQSCTAKKSKTTNPNKTSGSTSTPSAATQKANDSAIPASSETTSRQETPQPVDPKQTEKDSRDEEEAENDGGNTVTLKTQKSLDSLVEPNLEDYNDGTDDANYRKDLKEY